MKVLDVDLLQEGIQRNVAMLSRQRNEIEAVSNTISALVAMEEALKGQGGDAIRAFYEECHLPFLQFLMTFQESFTQVLKAMEAALRGFEPDAAGFIRESFLEGEIEQGLQQIAQLTDSLTLEANGIMDQVSDIVALPHLDDGEVQEGVRHAKIKRDDTNTGLYEFDASQTYALTTIEQDLATMEMWLADLQGLFKEGLTGVNFSADRWAMLSATNTLWTDLIHRTMPLGSLQSMQGIDGSLGFPYVPAAGGLMGVSTSSEEEAVEGNVGANVAKGIGAGLWDAGKDFVSGIWDFVTNPKESIEGVVHAVTHPVETYTYLKNAIVESYERDVINGDSYSRSRWFSYAAGTAVTSIVGTKGAGNLGKAGAVRAGTAINKGTATVQNALQSSDLLRLMPYNPRTQFAMAGDAPVPFNVMNGPVVKEQVIQQAKAIESKDMVMGKGTKIEVAYGTHIGRVGNKKVLQSNVRYKTKEGYTYETNEFGRIESVDADLQLGKGKRNPYAQSNVGETDRIRGNYPERDDGGHLIGSQFKGSGDIDNLVPMNSQINQAGGKWHQMEQEWAAALNREEGSAKVKIKPQYTGNSARPDSFMVEYAIDGGRTKKVTIKNQIGG
ncbi:T7SS effector LXG polymorphic toxin [Sporosarcina sp. HYO08]|uniref:T7SS effector LXG polymorphic toxin n=1 Tax=Sporosarcina sp. HYO08 TaxID=1759557 RepID=UPI000796EE95|nr:T7SS effector LXG polymorphic toxin [Sporosarcina sp. HYO08]KXH78560.1 hypothetical protein AU377_12840 [Sporosarcina sp. HYO08]